MVLPGNITQTPDCKQEPNAFEDETFLKFKESENIPFWLLCPTLALMVTTLCRGCKLF